VTQLAIPAQPVGIAFFILISAAGGTFVLHYLKNYLLEEKSKFRWDWDGILERGLITCLIITDRWLYLIPLIIILKAAYRLGLVNYFEKLLRVNEPGTVPQKVRLKAELAFDLILSPAIAILAAIVF
jgi:hypothetical protein